MTTAKEEKKTLKKKKKEIKIRKYSIHNIT
jgi:hypothetical protein